MKAKLCDRQLLFVVFFTLISDSFCAMTMKQLQKSMDMMRDACSPKFILTPEQLERLRRGVFLEKKELKCYTLCIAQMAGTITKKNEISYEKTVKQLETMLPPDVKQLAIDTFTQCRDVQKQYKDLCEKHFIQRNVRTNCNQTNSCFPKNVAIVYRGVFSSKENHKKLIKKIVIGPVLRPISCENHHFLDCI